MKNLFKINLAMILGLFLITSCGKTKDVKVQEEKAITQAEMQNKANPYDEQGEMYDGFLNAITSDTGRDIGGWDVGQLAAFRKDVGGWDVGQIATNNGIEGWDVGQVISFALAVNEDNSKDAGDKAKRIQSMQLEAFSGMQQISSAYECQVYPDRCPDYIVLAKALEPSNGGTAHDRTIKYINGVRDLEAKTQANDKMNKAEKEAFLISLSIVRHAAGYWYNESRNSNVPVGKITANMVHLSTLGALTAFVATDTKEVGVGTAILSAYVATGRAK